LNYSEQINAYQTWLSSAFAGLRSTVFLVALNYSKDWIKIGLIILTLETLKAV